MSNLVIVESPGKTKTIAKYLGQGWQVTASYGHIRDLPEKDLGVDPKTFEPTYVPTDRGKKRIADLKDMLAKVETVYLATDPDREGEAIAWHLQDALKLKNAKRITFTEITEKAVKQAIEKPGTVDMNLVRAQEARRVLDRLVGYPVSSALGKVLGKGKSAGRVQSPAVKIVVDREREIQDFKATTHFGVETVFEALDNIASGWKAQWKTKDFLPEGNEYILSKDLAEKVASLKYYIVASFSDSESKQAPAAPFTTSALQQKASSALKFSPKKTMELAQKLYESGHITYMRTDSPNISPEAIADIQEYCRANNLPAADKPRTWKSKEGAQEAHEAIRPTNVAVETAGESDEHQALYTLIRNQAIASQMAEAIFAVRKAVLQSEEMLEDKPVTLEATGRTLITSGWKALLQEDEEEDKEASASNPIPELRPESRLLVQSTKVQTKQTKPPARYTEATLVKQMEGLGIGRPATYAAILENIIHTRKYLDIDKKRNLLPTPEGYAVVDHLNGQFEFMDLNFTKGLEDLLDDIATGKATYSEVIGSFQGRLSTELAAFNDQYGFSCPLCGAKLYHKQKKDVYDFWSCANWNNDPKCPFTASNDQGRPGARTDDRPKEPIQVTEYLCQACGKPLVHKKGKAKNGKPYEFFGCSGYPKCRELYNVKDGKPELESK